MRNNIKKRGEITTEQIVLIIILVVSFAIILFFLVRLNLGKTTDQETCYNSVVTRGAGVIPKESVPLNCKTQYVCITKDGSCEAMTSPQIEKVKTKEEVYSFLANQMADCWWMFGEGKLNYVGNEFLSKLYCSICSQISFDNSVDMFDNGQIDQKSLYEYLAITNVSEEKGSYLEYLVGLKTASTIEESLQSSNAEFGKIDLSKQYYVVTGIYSEVEIAGWAGGGVVIGAIAGGIFAGGPIGIIIGGIAGGGGGYFIGTAVQGTGHSYLSPTIVEANSEAFNSLKCASIKTLG
jgi:hypothetical protein